MKRMVIVTIFAVVIGLVGGGAGVAGAQPPAKKPTQKPKPAPKPTPTPMAAAADRAYAEFTVGPTFGHNSSSSFGAEGGYWFGDFLGVFAEGGRMRNVAGSDIEDHANKIARTFNAVSTAKQPATYFAGGVAARMLTSGRLTPYALLGFGAAKVSNNVRFVLNGTDVTARVGDYGVQLGGDLSGSYTSGFIMFGLGTHISFAERWIADVSYRYGRVGKNTDAEIGSLSTNRLQFGVGAKF